jgi:hypothetical protein
MRKSLLTTMMLTLAVGIGATTASADYTSTTACKAAQAWDAQAAKCVSCKTLVTEAKSLKSCKACKAGTAFDITEKKCEKVVVKKS